MKPKMKDGGKSGRGVQSTLIVCAAALAALLCVFAYQTVRLLTKTPDSPAPAAAPTPSLALATPEDKLPRNLVIGRKPAAPALYDEQNRAVFVNDLAAQSKNGVWLVFWASWCPDCARQFEILGEMARLAEDSQVDLILIDRLNPQKETREAAKKKLEETGVKVRCLYDEDEACYRTWGMREIPSAVVLSPKGQVLEYRAGTLSLSACKGMLDRALAGRDAPGLRYILSRFSNGEGGIFTSTVSSASPSGQDVLSESQGLMMQYALAADNPSLFDQIWGFTQAHMLSNGLAAWYTDAEGRKAGVNALLDDLRIWDALRRAAAKWGGGYAEQADAMRDALLRYCLDSQGRFVSFTEMETGRRADSISLCYLDLEILSALADADSAFAAARDSARAILLGGRISDEFPLYYASYHYPSGTYGAEELNTAEALYTLWNLARAGLLPEDTMAWLRERVMCGDLAARYSKDGKAAQTYHSTAVWGLAALTAQAAGDEETMEWAVRRMERLCVTDESDSLYGAYCQKGAASYAFDQLIPLLVNEALNERTSL